MIINLEDSVSIIKTDFSDVAVDWAGRTADPAELSGHPGAEVIRKIEKSIEFMLAHLNRPLQVATLAAVASISSSHFFATFKQLTGCAPIEFFIGLRMRRACELLDSTSLSIKEIAAELGYDDQFYFSRVFKLATQAPPTQYRTLSMETRKHIKGNIVPAATQFQSLQPSRLAFPGLVPVCAGLSGRRPVVSSFSVAASNNF